MFMHIVLALMLLLGLSYAWVASDRENPQSVRQAQQELDNLRGFAFSANRFVASNYQFDGVLTWRGTEGSTALSEADSTPASLRSSGVPDDWRVVAAKGDFVLCVQLSEAAIALVGHTLPDRISGHVIDSAGASAGAVVFAADEDVRISDNGVDDEQSLSEAQKWGQTCTT